MIKYVDKDGDIMFVGTAREICSLHKNLCKRYLAQPSHSDDPKFNMYRLYGLHLSHWTLDDEWMREPDMYVMNSSTVLDFLTHANDELWEGNPSAFVEEKRW